MLAADPGDRLQGIMQTDLVSISPETDLAIVACLLEEHELLVLPVLDVTGELLGVVTIEAVLSWLLSPQQRARHWLPTQQPERPQEHRLPWRAKGVVRG